MDEIIGNVRSGGFCRVRLYSIGEQRIGRGIVGNRIKRGRNICDFKQDASSSESLGKQTDPQGSGKLFSSLEYHESIIVMREGIQLFLAKIGYAMPA